MNKVEQPFVYWVKPVDHRDLLPAMTESDGGHTAMAFDLSKCDGGQMFVWIRTEDGQWSDDSILFGGFKSPCCHCCGH